MVKLFRKESYFKNNKYIKFCRFPGCGVMFRPDNNPYNNGLCYVHRKLYQKEHNKWYANLSPEKKKEYIKKSVLANKEWVIKNIDRRRKIALKSYHKRKHLHKDVCCGGRMFWYDKKNDNTLYVDNRKTEIVDNPYRPNHTIKPDILMDFRKLDLPDESFKLVVFDPPHLLQKKDATNSAMLYGVLDKDTWREDLKMGFKECWRVLEKNGVLVFKWNESSIKISEVLPLFEKPPLFGNRQGTKLNTHWLVFMKL